MYLIQEACEAAGPEIFIYEEPENKCYYILASFNVLTACWRQNWKYLNKTTSVIRSLFIKDMQIGNSSADSRNLVTDYEKQV